MRDFAPDAYELEVVKQMERMAPNRKLRCMDCWCGDCGLYRYMLEVDGKADYLCLTCRLEALPSRKEREKGA